MSRICIQPHIIQGEVKYKVQKEVSLFFGLIRFWMNTYTPDQTFIGIEGELQYSYKLLLFDTELEAMEYTEQLNRK